MYMRFIAELMYVVSADFMHVVNAVLMFQVTRRLIRNTGSLFNPVGLTWPVCKAEQIHANLMYVSLQGLCSMWAQNFFVSQ